MNNVFDIKLFESKFDFIELPTFSAGPTTIGRFGCSVHTGHSEITDVSSKYSCEFPLTIAPCENVN